MGTSGISSGFPLLFRSSGQVAHVLRTRSPLGLHRCCHRMDPVRLACIRHAASVRPEPGSNSPSRPDVGEPTLRSFEEPARGLTPLADWHQKRSLLSVISAIDFYDRRRRTRRSPRSPALAFGCSYSVLKERRRSTLPRGRRCPCALQDRCDRHVDRTRHWPHIATGVRSSRLSSIYFGRFRHRSGILH